MKKFNDVSISRLTSFQNVGDISQLYVVENESDVKNLLKKELQLCVIGRGSNSVVFSTSESVFVQVSPDFVPLTLENSALTASAGVSVNKLLSFCKDRGVMGLTFSAGVPASVGGMVAMNFGCWGQEISDCLHSAYVSFPDGTFEWILCEDLQFSYRSSRILKEKGLVLAAKFNIQISTPDVVRDDISDKVRRRLASQPLRGKTFGSIFKNPPGKFSGELIESEGLKGFRVGDAQLSDQHANFMVNVGNATVEDVKKLIEMVREKVFKSTGISLVEEVQYLS